MGPASILHLDRSGQVMYLMDADRRDIPALVSMDLATGQKTLLAQDARTEPSDFMVHPYERRIQAVSFNYDRKRWQTIDPAVEADLRFLETVADGDISITSRTLDDQFWAIAYASDVRPIRQYIYDRRRMKASFVFSAQPELDRFSLARMRPVVIKSRDGLDLVCYCTLPPQSAGDNAGGPDRPLPMVLLVHGGPWERDEWKLNPHHQWLANRGYAVLSVNFRGSKGFGMSFLNAGNGEWGGKMQDDLIDAVNWAIEQKIADPKKIAIMGGSYGGYATLVGLTFTPDTFACGIDICGPSDLTAMMKTYSPAFPIYRTRIGDETTEEGRKLLESRSPLTFVDRIKKPLLIGHGVNDTRVMLSESNQIVNAMLEKKIPVTYVVYGDEGHDFVRPESRLSFYAIAEAFLAEHLGGAVEPIGDDFTGAAINVPVGAEQVRGLSAAMEMLESQKATLRTSTTPR